MLPRRSSSKFRLIPLPVRRTAFCTSIVLCLFAWSPNNASGAVIGLLDGTVSAFFDSGLVDGSGTPLVDGPHSVAIDGLARNAVIRMNYEKTFTNGNNIARASAGGWHFWDSDLIKAGWSGGTGVSQFAPDGNNNAARLVLRYEGTYEIEGPWGPLTAWYNLPIQLSVSGAQGTQE